MTGQHLRRSLVLANDGTIDLIAVGIAACGTRPAALTSAERQLAVGRILIAHAHCSIGKPFPQAGQLAAARERARRITELSAGQASARQAGAAILQAFAAWQMERPSGDAELSCTGAMPR